VWFLRYASGQTDRLTDILITILGRPSVVLVYQNLHPILATLTIGIS